MIDTTLPIYIQFSQPYGDYKHATRLSQGPSALKNKRRNVEMLSGAFIAVTFNKSIPQDTYIYVNMGFSYDYAGESETIIYHSGYIAPKKGIMLRVPVLNTALKKHDNYLIVTTKVLGPVPPDAALGDIDVVIGEDALSYAACVL